MRRVAAITRAIPAPVSGWDTREALADMPPDRASRLDNWFPTTDKVITRPGYTQWVTGIGGAVESLLPYVGTTGAGQIFAASGTSIFDATSSGVAGAAVVSGLSNARWQHVQMTTAGGQFLFICNGQDTPRTYNGTTWANTTATGPTMTDVIWCNTHSRRMWFGTKDSLSAWYLGVNAIGGAATEFPLGGLARLGGYIMAMGTWSRDAGDGAADLAVFITSEGECIIYRGIDPAVPADWELVGVFRIGRPIGRRCAIKTASDLIVVTESGIVAMSSVLTQDQSQVERVALSSQIARAVNTAARSYGLVYGWQPFLYPRGQMLIVNAPLSSAAAVQFVFNTVTGAPCRFVDIPSICWGFLAGSAYFGTGDGRVCLFDSSATDSGAAVNAVAIQAYNYFGDPTRVKRFGHLEPILESLAQPNVAADLCIDFREPSAAAAPLPSQGNANLALWGSSLWGSGTWAAEASIWDGWRGAYGVGRAAAVRMVVPAASERIAWIATNIQMTPGGAF